MRSIPALTITVCLALLVYTNAGHAESKQVVIKKAITTFKQRKPDLGQLRKAAITGDKEAQFYLAETLRLSSGYMTSEAHLWYENSAKQGDIYSIYRLSKLKQDTCNKIGNCPPRVSPKTWSNKLLEIAQEKAKQGDREAMEMMYILTGDLDWLVNSANLDHPSAQNWLAVRYERGDGWFLWPGQRKREITRLYKASAEGGYPRAISQHAGNLLLRGDVEGAQTWIMKGVAISYAPAVGAYAYNLEHGEYYHFKKDLTLAYTLYLLLSEIGGGASDAAEYSLQNIKPQLTTHQINSAIKEANEWKAKHLPLSYYPHKLESH